MVGVWHDGGEAELDGGAAGEPVAALPQEVPGPGLLPFDRVRNGQVCRGVPCPLLLVLGEEARVVALIAQAIL